MLRLAQSILALLVFLIIGVSAQAQSLYDQDLSQLSGLLRSLMVRAERVQPKDKAGQLAIQKELFRLSKKLHRLEEEALGANFELVRKGNAPDRNLLLAASIANTLDSAQSLTSHYLDTRDKIFLAFALQAAKSARNMQANQ